MTLSLALSAACAAAQGTGPQPVAHADPARWPQVLSTTAAAWPRQVAQVAELQGAVWLRVAGASEWREAALNWPLAPGDTLHTGAGGRVRLVFGAQTLWVGEGSALRWLDEAAGPMAVVQLDEGSAVLDSAAPGRDDLRLQFGALQLRSLDAGAIRVDVAGGQGRVGVMGRGRGELGRPGLDSGGGWAEAMVLTSGEAWRGPVDGSGGGLRAWGRSGLADDALAAWVLRSQAAVAGRASSDLWRDLPPDLPGAVALAGHGDWLLHPQWGRVWRPRVANDWLPYRDGEWFAHPRWGLTWRDAAPWGFATSHYGRWVQWGSRWVWTPGPWQARPAFSPALVLWYSGPQVSVQARWSSGLGLGWAPLPLGQAYLPPPAYRLPPGGAVWTGRPHWGQPGGLRPADRAPRQVPTGPILYGRDGVPTGVQPVPGARGQPGVPQAYGRDGLPAGVQPAPGASGRGVAPQAYGADGLPSAVQPAAGARTTWSTGPSAVGREGVPAGVPTSPAPQLRAPLPQPSAVPAPSFAPPAAAPQGPPAGPQGSAPGRVSTAPAAPASPSVTPGQALGVPTWGGPSVGRAVPAAAALPTEREAARVSPVGAPAAAPSTSVAPERPAVPQRATFSGEGTAVPSQAPAPAATDGRFRSGGGRQDPR